jgi:hypothetical protein
LGALRSPDGRLASTIAVIDSVAAISTFPESPSALGTVGDCVAVAVAVGCGATVAVGGGGVAVGRVSCAASAASVAVIVGTRVGVLVGVGEGEGLPPQPASNGPTTTASSRARDSRALRDRVGADLIDALLQKVNGRIYEIRRFVKSIWRTGRLMPAERDLIGFGRRRVLYLHRTGAPQIECGSFLL